MKLSSSRFSFNIGSSAVITFVFILLNLVLFYYCVTRPIDWVNGELLDHGFFWSMVSPTDLHLRTGLHLIDFQKIFYPQYVEGGLRMRPVSYLFAMLSFKFWQLFGLVYGQNYGHVLLHLVNTVLIGYGLALITGRKRVGVTGALLFLNSGIALATLMYPFRNAKLLVLTFFLLGVCPALDTRITSRQLRHRTTWAALCFILALLTDETSYFLVPIGYAWLFYRHRNDPALMKSFLRKTVYGALVFIVLLGVFLLKSRTWAYPNLYSGELHKVIHFLCIPSTYRDLWVAFSKYFLRFQFNFWQGGWEGQAGIVCLVLLSGGWLTCVPEEKFLKLTAALLLLIFVKNLLMPHDTMGMSSYMFNFDHMKFSTTLVFIYYYPYCDSFLLCCAIAVLFSRCVINLKKYVLLLVIATLLAGSGVAVNRNGPYFPLRYFGWDSQARDWMRKILSLDNVVRKYDRVYVSYFVDHHNLIDGRMRHQNGYVVERVLLPRYLKAIEQGKLIVSSDNITPVWLGHGTPSQKILYARFFYNLFRKKMIPMAVFHNRPNGSRVSRIEGIFKHSYRVNPGAGRVVLFLRGFGSFKIEANGRILSSRQSYGNGFQAFSYPLSVWELPPGQMTRMTFTIHPKEKHPVLLYGPFFVDGKTTVSQNK